MFPGIEPTVFDDPNFKEDSVRETIISPILSRLGYQVTGPSRVIRSKALKHPFIRVGVRNHPVTTIPDYTLYNEETPIFVLDAKAPNESILQDKHVQQAYSYAIHPEIKCQEFGLCNGRQLVVFNINQRDPLFILNFEKFEPCWNEIEKYLSPKYLLKPSLRKFNPDFGFKLNRLGMKKDTELIMLGVRLHIFAKISEDFITAGTNIDFGDEPHCVSFDFPIEMLTQIVEGLPKELGEKFCNALRTAPFQADAGLVIELDLIAKLGEETRGQYEYFVPLLVQKIQESRFNPSAVANEPTDVPQHMFQLRKAFKIRTIDDESV